MNETVIKTDELNPYGGNTFEVADFVNQIKQRHPDLAPEWFTTGIPCAALAPGSPWKNGRLRISVEFVENSSPEVKQTIKSQG